MATKQKRRSAVKCLNCPNKAFSRGCCPNCLHAAHRLIRTGEKTEQELIDLKMILPTQRRGRKISVSPFLNKLAKAKG
jgi:hypothetical protein